MRTIERATVISVEQAIRLVYAHSVRSDRTQMLSCLEASSCVLSEDIVSPIDMPPFSQSAMDGYALRLHPKADADAYRIVDEICPGDEKHTVLRTGEAVRIFTGAPVPDTADAVIRQERVQVEAPVLKCVESVSVGENIRPLGEQLKRGETALKQGTRLNPAAVGFLSALGIASVPVLKKPSIALIATGNELIDNHQQLRRGQIYESNNAMLSSALRRLGYGDVSVCKCRDDAQKITDLLGRAIREREVVLITGGISVGDFDFVGNALQDLGVETIFYKVRQKPGKPLFFGKRGRTLVFALPGNPASALTCFYIYVCPALQRIAGETGFQLNPSTKESASHFVKRGNRAQFLKSLVKGEKVHILGGQSSAMLQSFAQADALVYMPEDTAEIKPGDGVETFILPA